MSLKVDSSSNCIPILDSVSDKHLQENIIPEGKPVVLKGFVAEWPAVQQSTDRQSACDYLRRFNHSNHQVETFVGDSSINGCFFFNEDLSGFNFSRIKEEFSDALKRLESAQGGLADSVYVGSVPLPQSMPAFIQENALSAIPRNSTPRIWLNNKVTVQPHYDQSDNVACVVTGKRRFILFSPDQIGNLYPSPFERTIAGPQLSMVPFQNPDLNEFPRYQEALDKAVVVELEPGDAIYIPSLWWHGVESLTDFNVLVNYWWNTQYGPDSPFATLIHGLLTMKNLSPAEKRAWQSLFDYFLFQDEVEPMGHLPPELRGVLGELTPNSYQQIKSHFMKMTINK